MNSESSSKIQRTQSGKSTSKRAHRANRPVLVTARENAGIDEPTRQAVEEVTQPATSTALEEISEPEPQVERKRRPGFYSNIGKSERASDKPEADPKAARMARAMRGKVVDGPKETEKEKKPAASASRASAAPTRPRSGFKMRYIWGMMLYLLIADFLGIWITNWMVANHLDAVLFRWGSFQASRSTLIFLALLVVILIVMARFDLIPRSFRAMGDTSTRRGSAPASRTAPTFETKTPQPTIKQGEPGKDDALYREYRANQRYFQKRDRKR